jgi:hypothetical protein
VIAGGERRSCCSRVPRAERAASRFLTREARPNQSNPYVPWRVDPLGALISPLALLALIYGRKRKRSKWDTLVILLVLGGTLGMSLSACKGPTEIPTKINITISPTPTPTPSSTPTPSATVTPTLTGNPGQGAPTLAYTCTFTPAPTPTDDELHLTLEEFPIAEDLVNHIKNESDALILARLAVGEGAQGNLQDQEYVMWTVRIRVAIGFNSYNRGDYKNGPKSPTDIKTEVFSTRGRPQYQTMTGGPDPEDPSKEYYLGLVTLPDGPIFGMAGEDCTDAKRRMANPCDETDTQRLRDAYNLAQDILTKDIMQAPEEIRGFESFEGSKVNTPFCDFGDYEPPYTRQGKRFVDGGNIYKDCVLPDNIFFGLPSPLKNP